MQAGGFAGGLFAIYVPSPAEEGDAALDSLMDAPPYRLPLPEPLPLAASQAVAFGLAALVLLVMPMLQPLDQRRMEPGAFEPAHAFGHQRVGQPPLQGALQCRELLRAVHAGHLHRVRDAVRGHLVVSAPAAFGRRHVAPHATAFKARHPGLLAHLVYLDAALPYPGDSWSSHHSEETKAARIASAQASGGLHFPPPDAKLFGLEGADRDWVNRRQTPQPFKLYQQPLDFDAERVAAVPRTFIDCTMPALATIAPSRARVRSDARSEPEPGSL